MKRAMPSLRPEPVRVYRNLCDRCISVMGGDRKVAGHCISVVLENVAFTVNENARQRVLREQCKNVHAYAVGKMIAVSEKLLTQESEQGVWVSYNPYSSGHFYRMDTGRAVIGCKKAIIVPDGVIAFGLTEDSFKAVEFVQGNLF